MKTYNRSLDMMALALQQAKLGNTAVAAKLLIKASSAPDSDKALSILEASNAQAFEIQAKAVKAAVEAKSKAVARRKAGVEDAAIEHEEDDLADLIDDEGDDENKKEEVEAEDKDEEVDEEDMGEAIATVLAAMKAKAKAKKK